MFNYKQTFVFCIFLLALISCRESIQKEEISHQTEISKSFCVGIERIGSGIIEKFDQIKFFASYQQIETSSLDFKWFQDDLLVSTTNEYTFSSDKVGIFKLKLAIFDKSLGLLGTDCIQIEVKNPPVIEDITGVKKYSINADLNNKKVTFVVSNTSKTPLSVSFAGSKGINKKENSDLNPNYSKNISATRNQNSISEMNPNIDSFNSTAVNKFTRNNAEAPKKYNSYIPEKEGTEKNFYIENNKYNSINATCRKLSKINTENGLKNLNIFVENREWNNSVNQNMVDKLSSNILSDGKGNDIYDKLTCIFGNEWGPHNFNNLIDPEINSITIFMLDIPEDGVLGFFWAKDIFLDEPGSNKRLILYIDSRYGIEYAISTIVHEFQHLIFFYQKSVLNDSEYEIWLTEMCSMSAEDLYAEDSLSDRLKLYCNSCIKDPVPLFDWYNNDQVLLNYSTSYCFGAYLLRNFGPDLFKNILQNNLKSSDSIDYALSRSAANVSNESFASIMPKWSVAQYLSNRSNNPELFNLNKSIDIEINGINFSTSPINLYKYIETLPGESLKMNNIYKTITVKPCTNILLYTGIHNDIAEWNFKYPDDVKVFAIIE